MTLTTEDISDIAGAVESARVSECEQDILRDFPEQVDEEILQLQASFRQKMARLNQETQAKVAEYEEQIKGFRMSEKERQMVHWIDLFHFVGAKTQSAQSFIRKKLDSRSKRGIDRRVAGGPGGAEERLGNEEQVPSADQLAVRPAQAGNGASTESVLVGSESGGRREAEDGPVQVGRR